MLDDLKLSDTVYGLGPGIFFIGYFIFEVPINVILHRTEARVGIARIKMKVLGLNARRRPVSTHPSELEKAQD